MHKPLILIIDTSPETRSMYAHYFRYNGYRVVQADDGEEVVRMFPGMRPALVITELSEDPGWARALRLLRWPRSGGKTAVIACSTMIDRWRGVPEGIDVDVALPKPTSPRTLLREAERLLARRAQVGHGPVDRASTPRSLALAPRREMPGLMPRSA
jgi:DNA-binding response OmpR family regulator